MKRNSALEFIRDNSRVIADMSLPTTQRMYEHRIGNNGTPFILLDMGEHGWELFFINEGNNVDEAIECFCERTGATIIDGEAYEGKRQVEHDLYLSETLHENGEPIK